MSVSEALSLCPAMRCAGLHVDKLVKNKRSPTVVDFRNRFRPEDAKQAGMVYHSLGRMRQTGRRVRDKGVLVGSR